MKKKSRTSGGKKSAYTYGTHYLNGDWAVSSNPIGDSVFFIMALVALALPNLIFSGTFWFQTLHMLKWFFAMVPIGILAICLGGRLLWSGADAVDFKIDIFGWIWLFMVLYVTVQPLWADVRSIATLVREWYFFATLWIAYVLFYNYFKGKYLRPILWAANINAALNVAFAELQFSHLNQFFPFILPTPGHYIGNTGQQNMLGFWLAMCSLNCVFLHFGDESGDDAKYGKFLRITNLLLLFIIAWGIWGSTSRSGILSLFAGLIFLWGITFRLYGKERRKKLGRATVVLFVALVSSMVLNHVRMESMWYKTLDVLRNPRTIGSRDSIWLTSWYVFKGHPLKGVGLGQFKWNYLDGQKEMLKYHPGMDWKYTCWSHNEYLQWFCEAGFLPGVILVCMALWWLWSFLRSMVSKKELSIEAVWGISMLGLIWFNAFWTRPFHRIEDALWMSLAFALANREILPLEAVWTKVRRGYLFRALGAIVLACSVAGFAYLFNGMQGDVLLRKGVQSRLPFVQRSFFERAHKHLLVRDIAERQLAYHYLAVGKVTHNAEDTIEGVNRLFRYFHTEPHSRELKALLELGIKLRDPKLIREMTSYLKKGSYGVKQKKD